MSQARASLSNTLLKLADTHFAVSNFNQAYSMALEEAKRNNQHEFGMDEIAPQLEKLIQPLLMAVDLTNKIDYLKLSDWTKHHTWEEEKIFTFEKQDIFSKCIAIQGMVASLLPVIKEEQKKQKIVGKIISISKNGPDFKSIISVRRKINGTYPGMDVTILKKDGLHQTYTIKQGSTGNNIAECFTSNVTRKMIGIENTSTKINNKPLIKTIIAPAYLVFRDNNKKPTSLPDSLKGLIPSEEKSETIEKACKQVWVASEWSNDQVSFEACKLFGLEKKTFMAGTFQKELFANLRTLNQYCQLGLESILIAATYTCDFDLHLENFMLKINTSCISEENKPSANKSIEQLKKNISDTQKIVEEKKSVNSTKHLEMLINTISVLKYLGAEVYFQKIDHDNGFYRYADAERKVDFSTHRTLPLHISPRSAFPRIQPTSHITELTGTDGKGVDQLLLSYKAIDILFKNPLHRQLKIIHKAADTFFNDAENIASQMVNLTKEERQQAEYYLLKAFYFHLTDYDLDEPALPIKKLIADKQFWIKHYLKKGTIYKINNLQMQLYARILEKEHKKENLTPLQLYFKDFLSLQLVLNQAEFLTIAWPDISDYYDDILSIFKSTESCSLKNKINHYLFKLLHQPNINRTQILIQAYKEIQIYLKDNSHRRLGKLIIEHMAPVCNDIPTVQIDLLKKMNTIFDNLLTTKQEYSIDDIDKEVKSSPIKYPGTLFPSYVPGRKTSRNTNERTHKSSLTVVNNS